MSEVLRVMHETAQLWADALCLRAGAADHGHWLAYLVLLTVAVASWLVGQSVVLAVNRMTWRGILFTLLAGIVVLAANATVSGTLLWLGGAALLHSTTPGIVPFARVTLLGTAPLVFSCISVIPLLGPILERLLQLWTLAILATSVLGLWHAASPWQAAMVLGLVAALHLALLALVAPRAARLRDRLYRRLTGRPLHASADYLLELADA